jgi:hypothetical protein
VVGGGGEGEGGAEEEEEVEGGEGAESLEIEDVSDKIPAQTDAREKRKVGPSQ